MRRKLLSRGKQYISLKLSEGGIVELWNRSLSIPTRGYISSSIPRFQGFHSFESLREVYIVSHDLVVFNHASSQKKVSGKVRNPWNRWNRGIVNF